MSTQDLLDTPPFGKGMYALKSENPVERLKRSISNFFM
jgi:hypothetical protein